MLSVKDVISHIERTADPELAEEWDSSGLQAAGTRDPVRRLAVGLDPVEQVIERALSWGADFILTHHPLTLTPRLPSENDAYTRILRRLFQSGAWLYAAHTSLDANSAGPASWLADELGLRNTAPLLPYPRPPGGLSCECAQLPPGLGLIGDLEPALDAREFRETLAAAIEAPSWTCCGDWPGRIARVSYCPGSGMSLAGRAFDAGADVFISGDLKYHQAQDLEPLGLVLDVGHFSLEEAMMRAWAGELSRSLAGEDVETRFFPGHNPLRVLEGRK